MYKVPLPPLKLLLVVIASRLKDYFNKPSIVLTKSNKILKASARSTKNYNIGKIIKTLVDENIIEKGGGHNMAAGFSIKEDNLKTLDNFIQKDYLKNNKNFELIFKYDSEIPGSVINKNLYNEINKLAPYGSGNSLPIFLIKNVKIIKSRLVGDNHISSVIKPNTGASINSICFNSVNNKIGEYLLSYKKKVNIIVKNIDDLNKENLNLIVSVDKNNSKILICEYIINNIKPIILVGKGVTYDTGGYSIKDLKNMSGMHLDKIGGCMCLYLLEKIIKEKIIAEI